MLNANAVLEQVRAGTAPANWQVLRANRSYFVQQTVLGVLLTLGAITAAIYLLVTGTVVGYGLSDQTSDNVLLVWLVIDMLVLLALVITGIVMVIRHLGQMGSASEQMLVLTPEGVIQSLGSGEKQTTTYDYSAIAGMKTSVQSGSVYVLMQRRADGKQLKFEVNGRFGKPKQIAQQITGAFASAATARANAPQG